MKKLNVILFAMALLLGACGGGEAGTEGKPADDGMIEISQINKKGQKFVMEFTRTEEITGKSPDGKEATDHNAMTMWVELEVTDVDAEGNATMTGIYKRMTVSFEMMGQKMSYDTNDEPKDEMGAMFKESIGKTITMVADKKGHIKSVTGDKTSMDGSMWPDPTYTRFDNLREQMELDAVFPDKKVKVGDSWTSSNAVTAMYPMKLANTMTLKERKDGKATITVSSVITPNENQKPSFEIGQPHRMDLNGTREAVYVINEADGFISSVEATYKLEGTSRLEDPKSKKEMVNPVKMVVVDKFSYSKDQ